MSKGVSDRTLQRYWRKAVLLIHGNRCIICGKKKEDSGLESHHLVKRRKRVLKHDAKNGVPVCVGECHQVAHTRKGERLIADRLGAAQLEYLEERESWLIKDYRFSLSHSKEEHEEWELARLKEVIAKYQED